MNLLDNPFNIIGATIRDHQKKLIDLADQKLLLPEGEKYLNARNILLTPRKRLSSEIRWLPGCPDNEAREIISYLKNKDQSREHFLDITGLNLITKLNISVSCLSFFSFEDDNSSKRMILIVCKLFGSIDSEDLRQLINAERKISKFPLIEKISDVEAELQNLRKDIKGYLSYKLRQLSRERYISIITALAQEYISNLLIYGSAIIDDLITDYELNIIHELEAQKKEIISMINIINNNLNGAGSIYRLIDLIEHWVFIAKPLQLHAKATGAKNKIGEDLAYMIRNLAINLNNKHEKQFESLKIEKTLRKVFIEPEFLELVNKDINKIERLIKEENKKNYEQLSLF